MRSRTKGGEEDNYRYQFEILDAGRWRGGLGRTRRRLNLASVVKFTVSTTNGTDAAKEVTFNFVKWRGRKAPLSKSSRIRRGSSSSTDSKTISVCQYGQNVTVKLPGEHRACDGYDRGKSIGSKAVDTRAMIDKRTRSRCWRNMEGGPRDATIIFKRYRCFGAYRNQSRRARSDLSCRDSR